MRPEILYPLFCELSSLKGIGDKTFKLLNNLLGGSKVINLLWHLPSNVIDRSYTSDLSNVVADRIVTLKVKVIEHIAPKSKQQPYKVIVSDGKENLTLVFFKVYADSINKNLPLDEIRYISGKIEKFNGNLQMTHPDFIVKDINMIPKFEAVYPLTAGISNKLLNKLIKEALFRVCDMDEWIDNDLLQEKGWKSFKDSLIKAHNPLSLNDLTVYSPYRQRLAYDELLANQLTLAIARDRIKKVAGRSIKGDFNLRQKVIDILPFKLTKAQEKVLGEIYEDMAKPFRMQRLLQGDVGAGKTIVALLCMLNAVEQGLQAAIMAPTEILASQHLETILPIAQKIGIKVALLTGKTKAKERKEILLDLEKGEIDILIGTHALFQDEVIYHNLGFVVVDEQHRFGVKQRLELSKKGKNTDMLVMTATPIPRTLVLTAFGDMEYSKIEALPEGRKPVDTRVYPLGKLDEITNWLQKQINEGKQAYWVCPLVEESEKSDLAAAEKRFALMQKIFGLKVGLVHGKMKEQEKALMMEKFKSGELKLLVATTVIEVGVNVPNATIMIIEHAERFGLSQLHQLRGRVKRGSNAANCMLLYGMPLSETSAERLKIMKETEDGFIIAEKDLELRGGGEILGTRQSGFLDFKIADMEYDKSLLMIADKQAKLALNKDAKFETTQGKALRNLLYLFEKDEAIRTYKA